MKYQIVRVWAERRRSYFQVRYKYKLWPFWFWVSNYEMYTQTAIPKRFRSQYEAATFIEIENTPVPKHKVTYEVVKEIP